MTEVSRFRQVAAGTRFLPKKLLGLFERASWPAASHRAAAKATS